MEHYGYNQESEPLASRIPCTFSLYEYWWPNTNIAPVHHTVLKALLFFQILNIFYCSKWAKYIIYIKSKPVCSFFSITYSMKSNLLLPGDVDPVLLISHIPMYPWHLPNINKSVYPKVPVEDLHIYSINFKKTIMVFASHVRLSYEW